MLRYILIRILWVFPTLLLVSLLAFFLKEVAPGNEIARISGIQIDERASYSMEYIEAAYRSGAAKLNKDKPKFYFSMVPDNFPQAYFGNIYPSHREWIREVSKASLTRKQVSDLYTAAVALQRALSEGDKIDAPELFQYHKLDRLRSVCRTYMRSADADLAQHALALNRLIESVQKSSMRRHVLFSFRWHGFNNQYHYWITAFLSGEFGYSIVDGRPVTDKLASAAKWTLLMNGAALLLIFLIGIPIGVWLSKNGHLLGNLFEVILYILYATPLFILATLAVLFLTTETYAQWLNVFPSVGGYNLPRNTGFWGSLPYLYGILALPILCIVVGSLSYVAIQMRNNMQKEFGRKYFLTAKAKGLSQRVRLWGHAFPNALYSMITVLGQAIPALIGGSLVVELIFNISGMGRLLWDALYAEDWPVVFAAVFLGAIFTIIGQLIADILYAIANPKVTFSI